MHVLQTAYKLNWRMFVGVCMAQQHRVNSPFDQNSIYIFSRKGSEKERAKEGDTAVVF